MFQGSDFAGARGWFLAAAILGLSLAVSPAFASANGSQNRSAEHKTETFSAAIERAQDFDTLRTLHIAQDGSVVVAESFNGAAIETATNIKSASKSVISALVGIAIERRVLVSAQQPIAPLLRDQLPEDADPRIQEITIGNLLSMQAGLERTSGGNYGAWVSSDNWVKAALGMPFDDEPGGQMLYSTGNTHLLSAILMRETGRSTQRLANEWLAPAGIRIESWTTDPQGIPLGGNQMAMTPASLLALGELYRRDGRSANGDQLLSQDWIERSWTVRTHSRYTGDGYGYGWFIRDFGGYPGYYGWGYGGQMLYVVPELALTVAITSDIARPSGRTGYREDLHNLLAEHIIPAAEAHRRVAAGEQSPAATR